MLWFDAYYKWSPVSTQALGLWSCSINNSTASLWCSSLFSFSACTPFSFPYTFSSLKMPPVLLFLSTLVSLSGICPPLSSLGDSPCALCEPRNSWQLHFPSCVLPLSSFCLCACTRAWEAPSQAVTRFESYNNCRWSQTLHPYSQQLLPWRRAAPAWCQRPSSEPQSTWESPELRALTRTFTTRFVWALQLHIPCTALLLLYAGFLPL